MGFFKKRVLSSVSSLLYMRYLCRFCTHTITFVLFIYSWAADKQTEEEPNGNRRNTNCLSHCACANSLRSVGSQHSLSSGNTLKADSHIAGRAHAVPLPCRAAKGLECLSHLIYTARPCLIHTCHAALRTCRSS